MRQHPMSRRRSIKSTAVPTASPRPPQEPAVSTSVSHQRAVYDSDCFSSSTPHYSTMIRTVPDRNSVNGTRAWNV